MIYDHELTEAQRKKSQRAYNWFNIVNGASYMCLGESVIVLFAVQLGMSNTIISLVGAMLYLGYLLLPLGVWRTSHRGAAASQADFWVCRNIAALLVAFSMVFKYWHLPNLACCSLLSGAFMFYGFRAAGCVMGQPLIGDIATEEERPGVLAKSVAYFYGFGALALAIISFLLHINNSDAALVCIILAGVSLGLTASIFIRQIDETSQIRESAKKPFFSGLAFIQETKTVRKVIFAWFIVNLANLLILSMSLLAIKRGYGATDTNAVLFSLVQFVIMVFGSRLGAPLTKRMGPRKLIILSYFLYMPTALFWIFFPMLHLELTFGVWFIFIIPFVFQGMASVLSNNALTHYFLMAVPEEHRVCTSMLVNLITGAAAGLSGMIVAVTMVKISEDIVGADGSQSLVFSWYFSFALLVMMLLLPMILRIDTIIHQYRATHSEEDLQKTLTDRKITAHE